MRRERNITRIPWPGEARRACSGVVRLSSGQNVRSDSRSVRSGWTTSWWCDSLSASFSPTFTSPAYPNFPHFNLEPFNSNRPITCHPPTHQIPTAQLTWFHLRLLAHTAKNQISNCITQLADYRSHPHAQHWDESHSKISNDKLFFMGAALFELLKELKKHTRNWAFRFSTIYLFADIS